MPVPPCYATKRACAGPGFLEITLDRRTVIVHHHSWNGDGWEVQVLFEKGDFFGMGAAAED